MSRDWTPKEWDIVHQQDPGLKEHFNNIVFVDAEGNKTPLTSKEQKEQFEQFPKLNLIGNNLLNKCSNEGILSSSTGNKVVRMMENILCCVNYGEEFKDFEEKINLWYEGNLEPGHYMDDNDEAMLEEIKYMVNNWTEVD